MSEGRSHISVGQGTRRVFPDWPLEELRTKRGTADLYRMVYGPLSARWIMSRLGFPTPPRELVARPLQLELELGMPSDGGAPG